MGEVNKFYETVFRITDTAFHSNTKTKIRNITVAGIPIQLRFADSSLLPEIMPALKHLKEDSSEYTPSYTIDIWDSESTQTDFPEAPCGIDDILVRGELQGFSSDRYEAAFFTHARMLTLIDHHRKRGVVCLVNSSGLPAFELACPLRGILSWILRRNDTTMIHAASVGTADGSVLIGGKSGAGKSSTALRCLVGGLYYFGDDICAISNKNFMPQTHSIYSSGKTFSKDLKYFPELASSLHSHHEDLYEKEVFFFANEFQSQLPRSGDIRAIIIAHQDPDAAIGFEKISFANALSVMCSSTKQLLPNAGNEMFTILSSILHQTPCFRFNLGNDPSLIARTLDDLITNLKQKQD